MQIFQTDNGGQGLSAEQIKAALVQSLAGRTLKNVLIIPPDFTRFHSNAGFITNVYYHLLREQGCEVDILPALGTHEAMREEECAEMFGDIPFACFLEHNWRSDVVKIGEIPAAFMEEITEGLWTEAIGVEVNKLIMDEKYDLILSPGQVVPHEVIGMANHSKNVFVGVGGSEIINKSHMVSAVYGMERAMGKDFSPVRKMFDYALKKFLAERPILFILTVTTAPGGNIHTHGLFIGDERDALEAAIVLAQKMNIDFVEKGIQKCVVYLDPKEFKSTWLGNKSIYRTRMAVADGGELVVLAPGITKFGEDAKVDQLIRKYGYSGRLMVLDMFKAPENDDLRANMGAAAHLIHGSADGRFKVTYAVKEITQEEIAGVKFAPASYDEMVKKYDPNTLKYGWNTMPDGEEIYFIPNPALGLWIDRTRFDA